MSRTQLSLLPLLLVGASAALAQSISLSSTAYTQNFDTASGAPAALPSGWSFSEAGTGGNTTFATSNGSANTGNTYFLGSGTEWALGSLQSGTVIPTIGASFTNAYSDTATEFSISYDGETWRVGTANRADRLDFQYSLDATSLTNGTWTDVDALDYNSAARTATASGSMIQSASVTATVTGLSIAPGATFMIRWVDFNATSADDATAVDNFSITLVPEPGTYALGAGLAALAAAAVWRRRRS